MLAVLVATAASRVMTYTLKLLTDAAIAFGQGRGDTSEIWRWALVFPGVYLANEVVWRTSGFCGMRWITGAVAEASRRLFGYLSEHSATYFADRFAGALVNKVANAATGTERLISQWLWQFFPWIVGLLADLWITYLAHPYFALALAVWMAVYVPVNVLWVRRLHKLSFAYAEASSQLRGKMVDTTTNIDTVQLTGEVAFERQHVGESIGLQRLSHLREWWWSEWLLVTNGVLLALFILSMFGIGMGLISRGLISVGSLVMVVTVVIALEQRMFFLGQNLTQAVSYHGQVSEGLAELLQPHEITDRPGAAPLVVRRAGIAFEALSFSYRNARVFGGDFDLRIEGGEKVGLVGHSGAGKSTLVSLLLRQFELDGGTIRIDGQSVSDITLESLRRAVALVPQGTSLFHRSILDNIRYGRLAASDEEVVEAARLAEADGFIRQLPQGYDTQVGERGVKLSGGQRQRIAIARALLRNAPILLLDEATSALDSESEAAIQRALVGLMRDKTVIAIAHRLSTLRAMDRIVVLEQGRIVEDGSHEALVRRGRRLRQPLEQPGVGLYPRLDPSHRSPERAPRAREGPGLLSVPQSPEEGRPLPSQIPRVPARLGHARVLGPAQPVAADGAALRPALLLDDARRLRPAHLERPAVPAHDGEAVGSAEGLGVARREHRLLLARLLVVPPSLVVVVGVDERGLGEEGLRVAGNEEAPVHATRAEVLLGRGLAQLLEEAGPPTAQLLDDRVVEVLPDFEGIPGRGQERGQDVAAPGW